jgi:biopolymer transport protein ExbD
MLIITIPVQTHAVKMNMPVNSNAAPPPKPPEIMRIDVDFDGTIGWNGVIINDNELQTKLAAVAATPDQPEVHLRPNKLVSYKVVAHVMATAQRLGVTKIGLVGNEQFMN